MGRVSVVPSGGSNPLQLLRRAPVRCGARLPMVASRIACPEFRSVRRTGDAPPSLPMAVAFHASFYPQAPTLFRETSILRAFLLAFRQHLYRYRPFSLRRLLAGCYDHRRHLRCQRETLTGSRHHSRSRRQRRGCSCTICCAFRTSGSHCQCILTASRRWQGHLHDIVHRLSPGHRSRFASHVSFPRRQ